MTHEKKRQKEKEREMTDYQGHDLQRLREEEKHNDKCVVI